MDGYLTVNEAARRLGRSIEQVRRYLREGRLPGRRIGQQWFIEEEALTRWRPERRAAGRVGEAVATYEAITMKTDKTKKRERLIDEGLLREIDEIAERIREEAGEIDVVELIRQDREEH
jgi:excisionase family DNA binding protein